MNACCFGQPATWLRTVVALLGLGILSRSPVNGAGPDLALLVGCTTYQHHPGLRELYGPANDVPLWAALLTDPKGFAFPKGDVTQLVGWPDDEAKRPTFANIAKAFDNLVEKAGPDSRVVVVLSGHGIQVPIPAAQQDPLDPKNPEPDGLDEVFLPADVKDWNAEDGLKNAIRDDQVGAWLDRLRDKGAHVLIVFDCCHAGTMTRGGDGVREINRVADRKALGIPDDAVDNAHRRAREAVERARGAGQPIPGARKVAEKAGRGSLVAFYAAQPFQEAPELPLPIGSDVAPKNYYGMMCWTLTQVINARQGPLTYGELERLVATAYRSARGTSPPTPYAEGDLDREVLGMKAWPARPTIFLERERGRLRVTAGQLHGLTEGSILAIHPPLDDKQKRDPKAVLGHLRVATIGPSTAAVVPVDRRQTNEEVTWVEVPEKAEKVEDLAQCEVILRDFGDLRVNLFTASPVVKAALDKLAGEAKDMIRRGVDEPQAEWELRVTSQADAKKAYGVDIPAGESVLLLQGNGRTAEAKDPAGNRKVFGVYPANDVAALAGELTRDLPKIFKWQNLWRVAAGVNAADGGETHGLVLEVLKLKDENDRKGEPLRDGVLKDGQEVLWRIRNDGANALWVAAFYLDANLGIQVIFSGGVNGGQTVRLAQATASTRGGSFGVEGLVVFAVPQRAVAVQPSFSLLEQEPLRVANRGKGTDPGTRGETLPFHALLRQAAFNKGARGAELRLPSTPAILSRAWLLQR